MKSLWLSPALFLALAIDTFPHPVGIAALIFAAGGATFAWVAR